MVSVYIAFCYFLADGDLSVLIEYVGMAVTLVLSIWKEVGVNIYAFFDVLIERSVFTLLIKKWSGTDE